MAQTLADYRGNYAYNLTDQHYRRFNATVPQLIQWDDHEVINNWFPHESLVGQGRAGYTETDVDNSPATRTRRGANGSLWTRPKRSTAACTARCPTGRCSTCSCSTCAPTRTRTRRRGPRR
nr:alkaline phosphatase D family protein [Mycolicibacterium smegmatis]